MSNSTDINTNITTVLLIMMTSFIEHFSNITLNAPAQTVHMCVCAHAFICVHSCIYVCPGFKSEVAVESGLEEDQALEILALYVNGKPQRLPEQARSIVRECKGTCTHTEL